MSLILNLLIERIQVLREVHVGERSHQVPLAFEHQGHVDVGVDLVHLVLVRASQLQGFLEIPHGLVVLAGGGLEHTHVVVGKEALRVDLEGSQVASLGVCSVAIALVDNAQIVKDPYFLAELPLMLALEQP